MSEKTKQRSMRLPADLVAFAEEQGQKNERNFTKQVIYMLRVAKKKLEQPQQKRSDHA